MDRIVSLLARLGPLPAVADLSTADLLAAVSHDKKVLDGQLHFVLPAGIGQAAIVTDVDADELREAFLAAGCAA
jgi:3-dehydroquinate synthetase